MSAERIELTSPSPADNREQASVWRIGAWAVLGLTTILFFVRLGARALWSSEYRWAEIAREMLRTGNYFWPTLDGRLYYDKPLGSYWLVVASTWVTGGMNEAAARLPCALAGLLAVALLIVLVKRLYDLRTAVVAGIILATSFSFVFFSRTASADVETITGELAALALFFRHERKPDGWWVVPLWLVMAVTSQMKGLLGFVLPIMVIGTYATLADGWTEFGRGFLEGSLCSRVRWVAGRNRWLFNWRTPIAIALGVAVYVIPFRISQEMMHSDAGLYMVFRENVIRFFHPFDHRGPIYIYFYVTFALMAPWSLMLPAALVHTHYRRHIGLQDHARADRFVLVFFWSTFIFFTLSGSRRSYYILPILPAGAILVARLLAVESLSELSAWTRRLFTAGYSLFAVIVVFGFVVMLPPSWILPGPLAKLPDAPDRLLFGIFWALSAGSVIYAIATMRPGRVALSMALSAYLAMVYIFLVVLPAADAWRPEKPFAAVVVKRFGRNPPGLAFYKTQESLFYIDPPRPVPEFLREKDLIRAIRAGKVKWIIVRRKDLATVGVPTRISAAEQSYPWESRRDLGNKVVLVQVLPRGTDHQTAPGSPPS
jgi:4-amino-4-deoxy-L-arabinose transferase-like glycosyltransferase